MFSQRNKTLLTKETLFEKISQLAKEKDEETLSNLGLIGLLEAFRFEFFQGEYNPIILLAKEGNFEAVEFLITKLGVSLDYAVEGYAIGGHTDKVENLISRGASLQEAVKGYAIGGHVDKVKHLISRGASSLFALSGYAIGGHADEVENLIASGARLNDAVSGYATGGHADRVEDLISRGASLYDALWGYTKGGHVNKVQNLISRGVSINDAVTSYMERGFFKTREMTLRILTATTDVNIRKQLAQAIEKRFSYFSQKELLREGAKLNQLITESQMDFNQALLFMKPWMMRELHIWFLQGIQLVKERRFPLEIFIHISSFVLGFSNKDTKDLFDKHLEEMSRKLCYVSMTNTTENFKSLLNFSIFGYKKMTEAEFLKKQEEAMDRCEKRRII